MQIVSQEEASGLERLRAEYVVRIQGQLRKRSDPNPNMATGMVELVAEQVLSRILSLYQRHGLSGMLVFSMAQCTNLVAAHSSPEHPGSSLSG